MTHLDAQVTQLQEERNRLQENVNEQVIAISLLIGTFHCLSYLSFKIVLFYSRII